MKRTPSSDTVADSLEAARPHALRRALRLTDGDRTLAEDLVEEVVARLWERGRRHGEPSPSRTWSSP